MQVLGDITRLNVGRVPNKAAIVMNGETLTYAELDIRINQLANGLLEHGVRPGDRVALLAMNCLDYAVVAYAVAKCGCVLVPVNFRFQHGELVYVINNSSPAMLFVGSEFAQLVSEATTGFKSNPAIVSMTDEAIDGGTTLAALRANGRETEPGIEVDPSSAAMIMYTSGTTGFPKGVLFSHAANLAVAQGLVIEGDMDRDDVVLISVPMFHNAGLNVLLLPCLMMGATSHIMGSGFDPVKIMAAVAEHRISLTLWVPTMLAMLVDHKAVGNYDLGSLRKIWYGSSPISRRVLDASMRLFDAGFYQFYGQTESGMNSVLRPEDHAQRSQFTGREMVNAELRIVDENGDDVADGGVGEVIIAQKPLGMIGYYGDEAATREVVRGGWIYSGDLARVEGGGYFTIIDRKRDMIISGAENIYPKEVEDVIAGHPAVREVSVFGIPHDTYGESVCAAVVLQDGQTTSEEEIIAFCERKISHYKRPRAVEFHDELPKNASGKITKNRLREPHWMEEAKRV